MDKQSLDPEPSKLLADAFINHIEATIRLAKAALELEWTIFTRFIVGVIIATLLSIIYLVWTLRHSRRPLVVWERLNKPVIKLFRPRIFSFILRNTNPYSGSIDMRISTFSRGYCTGFMLDQPRIKNPFRSIHATAMVTFAELVSELCISSNLKDDQCHLNLVSFNMEYKKKARGLLTASAEYLLGEMKTDKEEVKLDVVIKDRSLDTVAVAHLVWFIEKESSA